MMIEWARLYNWLAVLNDWLGLEGDGVGVQVQNQKDGITYWSKGPKEEDIWGRKGYLGPEGIIYESQK